MSICSNALSLSLQQLSFLFFSVATQAFKYASFINAGSQVKQVSVPWNTIQKVRILEPTFWSQNSFLSLKEKLWVGYLFQITLNCVGLGEGIQWVKWNSFSYSFQYGYSWLWVCLGSNNFLTSFWSSHKGFLDHIFLLSQCLCWETRSRLPILPSCYHHHYQEYFLTSFICLTNFIKCLLHVSSRLSARNAMINNIMFTFSLLKFHHFLNSPSSILIPEL